MRISPSLKRIIDTPLVTQDPVLLLPLGIMNGWTGGMPCPSVDYKTTLVVGVVDIALHII
jgi:hypothetical protein